MTLKERRSGAYSLARSAFLALAEACAGVAGLLAFADHLLEPCFARGPAALIRTAEIGAFQIVTVAQARAGVPSRALGRDGVDRRQQRRCEHSRGDES